MNKKNLKQSRPYKALNKILMLLGVTLMLCSVPVETFAQQQTRSISGTAVDATGQPLPAVTVSIKGTTKGTTADADGKYTLNGVKTGDVLVFQYIGMKTKEVVISNQSVANVEMEDDAVKVDEVVVTALGMKRETKSLGYAFTEIKGDDLLTANSVNPVTALQGKTAGVDIAQSDGGMFGSTKIQIRGVSTLSGNNQPIYVVDGVILDNSTSSSGDADWSQATGDWGNELKNLNPDDFESVSILKGAAATALYGSRGLNGAVVITTKSGKATKGLGVSFSQTFGIDHVYKTPDLQNVWGAGTLAGWVDYGNTDASGNYYAWDTQHQFLQNSSGQNMLYQGESYGPRFDGSQILGYDNELTTYKANKNNYKNMYRDGFNSNTNVAVSGGNENTTFYASMSYNKRTGTLPRNSFERLSMLGKASHKINKYIDVEFSVNFAKSDPKNPQPNIGELFVDGTFMRDYVPDYYRHKYAGEHGGIASGSYGDKYASVPGIGLWWSIYENTNKRQETSFRPYIAVNVNILEWLRLKLEGNYNYYYVEGETMNPNSGYARTYDNGAGYYEMMQTKKKQANGAATLFANYKINDDWSVSGFVRGEYYDNKQSYMRAATNGGLVAPDQYFIKNSVNAPTMESYLLGNKRMLSIAASAEAVWRDQVYLTVTGRNDWSSSLVYSNGTGNYSYFYPSVSASWLIHETFRGKLPGWISFAKLRASWAQVGNDTEAYKINTSYNLNSTNKNGSSIPSLEIPNSIYEANLKPERKNAWEIGLDWRFLRNRIGIDFTYYKENTKNQIMSITVPWVSGVNSQLVNAGNIQNSGIELNLHTVPFKQGDWQWDLDFTYTRNKSKIVSLHENVADYILLDGSTNYGNYRIGAVAKVGAEYGLLVTDSKPKIDAATGLEVLTYSNTRRSAYAQRSGKEEFLNSINPKFTGSIATTLRWKDLSLHIGLDMRFGGYIASYNSRYGTAYGFTKESLKYSAPEYGGMTWTSAWDGITYSDGLIPEGIIAGGTVINQPDGTVHTVAASGESFQDLYDRGLVEPLHASAWNYFRNSWGQGVVNDSWYKKLNYIALREISVSYRLPQNIAKKIAAKSISVGVSGRNLCYLLNTAPNHENPESVRGTRSWDFRMRSFQSYTANYMFTLNVNF